MSRWLSLVMATLDGQEAEMVEWSGCCPACLAEEHGKCWGRLDSPCMCCGIHNIGHDKRSIELFLKQVVPD